MIKKSSLAVISVVIAAIACGCAEPKVTNPLPIANQSLAEVQTAAEEVMLDLGFEVERPPRAVGRVDTEPLVSASWFEFWRQDTIGARERMAASIHTIRRRAEIVVSPAEGGVSVAVKVTKERKSAAGREVIAPGDAYNVFDESRSGLKTDEELGQMDVEWENLGRDNALEERILQKIRKRLR